MTTLSISDELASAIHQAAAHRQCSAEDVLQFMLLQLECDDIVLSAEQEQRLRESIAQADQGQAIDGNVALARLDEALRAIEARLPHA